LRINPSEQYTFPQTHTIAEAAEIAAQGDVAQVSINGRLTGMRDQGSIVFGDLRDETGEMQLIAEPDTPDFEDFKRNGVGDWLGITGETGLSRRGAPSVFTEDWARLAATEVGFPDKRNGLTDPELRARQRYLDLAINPESLKRFQDRSRMISSIRRNLEGQGFTEVETPILQPIHGGASARPFETHHNALDEDMTLRIAPELYLKRLVVGGMRRVFEIGKDFRNEGISPRHNPEFTMMEVYGANWDYRDQMHLTETLIQGLAKELHGTDQISYQGEPVNLSAPWERATMDDLVSEAVGMPVSVDTSLEKMRALAETHGVEVLEQDGTGTILTGLYEKLVESNLKAPIFVTDYPREVSPLARDHRDRPGYTERFEGIIGGREICNGYTELNDARTQYERFREQEERKGVDPEAMEMDRDYVQALRYGLPPTAGLGIGIDRLAMLLTDAPTIKDVILFPTLRRADIKLPYDD
jgi:lysyl-tRNA synthetase class 2